MQKETSVLGMERKDVLQASPKEKGIHESRNRDRLSGAFVRGQSSITIPNNNLQIYFAYSYGCIYLLLQTCFDLKGDSFEFQASFSIFIFTLIFIIRSVMNMIGVLSDSRYMVQWTLDKVN